MPQSYWHIVIAIVVGLTVSAASPPQQQVGRQSSNPNQTPRGQESVLPWLIDPADNADDKDKPCEPGEDNRQSDLCAQWKSADAAADSANWARRSFILSIFGFVASLATLAAAVVAARGAWDAARYTKRGAEEARRGADAAEQAADRGKEANKIALQQYRSAFKPWPFVELSGKFVDNWKDIEPLLEGPDAQAMMSTYIKIVNNSPHPARISRVEVDVDGFAIESSMKPVTQYRTVRKEEPIWVDGSLVSNGTLSASVPHAVPIIAISRLLDTPGKSAFRFNPPIIIVRIWYGDPAGGMYEASFGFKPECVWGDRYVEWGASSINYDRQVEV